MTREEFESILEEAYIEGYNTAIEDIQEDILDEEAYDLEGEYDYYTEGIGDTKATKFGKAIMRGGDIVAKELGVSKGTRKNMAKLGMNIIGNAKPALRAKLLAKNTGKVLTSLAKDRDKIGKNVYDTVGSTALKMGELNPYKKQIESDMEKHNIGRKSDIVGKLAKHTGGRIRKIFNTITGNRFDKESDNPHHTWEKTDKRHVADAVKRAMVRKQDMEEQAANNREWNKEMSEKYHTTNRTNLFTKSGKFYNKKGKQNGRAVW